MKPTVLHPVLFHWMSKGATGIGRLAKLFPVDHSYCLTIFCVLTSFPASLQVDIVPSQGEISVGESKFFLCQGE